MPYICIFTLLKNVTFKDHSVTIIFTHVHTGKVIVRIITQARALGHTYKYVM